MRWWLALVLSCLNGASSCPIQDARSEPVSRSGPLLDWDARPNELWRRYGVVFEGSRDIICSPPDRARAVLAGFCREHRAGSGADFDAPAGSIRWKDVWANDPSFLRWCEVDDGLDVSIAHPVSAAPDARADLEELARRMMARGISVRPGFLHAAWFPDGLFDFDELEQLTGLSVFQSEVGQDSFGVSAVSWCKMGFKTRDGTLEALSSAFDDAYGIANERFFVWIPSYGGLVHVIGDDGDSRAEEAFFLDMLRAWRSSRSR